MTNLCCLLSPEVKCRECDEQWCNLCWYGPDGEGRATSHTTANKRNGGWGRCPKVNKFVGWDPSSKAGEVSWIQVRDAEGQRLYYE